MAGALVTSDCSRKNSLNKLLDLGVKLNDEWYDVDNIIYEPLDDLYDVGNIMYDLLGNQFVYVQNEYVQAPPA
ncbi:hypothetical protein SLA2020_278010 [Shorea laevis]